MTLEIKTYTDSAISDLFKQFFNHFKMENEYKYIIDIDASLLQSKTVVIDWNDNAIKLGIKNPYFENRYSLINQIIDISKSEVVE